MRDAGRSRIDSGNTTRAVGWRYGTGTFFALSRGTAHAKTRRSATNSLLTLPLEGGTDHQLLCQEGRLRTRISTAGNNPNHFGRAVGVGAYCGKNMTHFLARPPGAPGTRCGPTSGIRPPRSTDLDRASARLRSMPAPTGGGRAARRPEPRGCGCAHRSRSASGASVGRGNQISNRFLSGSGTSGHASCGVANHRLRCAAIAS